MISMDMNAYHVYNMTYLYIWHPLTHIHITCIHMTSVYLWHWLTCTHIIFIHIAFLFIGRLWTHTHVTYVLMIWSKKLAFCEAIVYICMWIPMSIKFICVCMYIPYKHTATHCTTLHHTAPHCTTLHHTAPHSYTLQYAVTHMVPRAVHFTWISPTFRKRRPVERSEKKIKGQKTMSVFQSRLLSISLLLVFNFVQIWQLSWCGGICWLDWMVWGLAQDCIYFLLCARQLLFISGYFGVKDSSFLMEGTFCFLKGTCGNSISTRY